MKVCGLDPGPKKSAVVVLDCEKAEVLSHFEGENEQVLVEFDRITADHLAIEMVASYGMPVGETVFDTAYWAGRFVEAWIGPYTRVYRKSRGDVEGVCMQLCKTNRKVTKANIRHAARDRFAKTGGGATPEVGIKSQPGPLYGMVGDHVYDALAVAITYYEHSEASEMLHELTPP